MTTLSMGSYSKKDGSLAVPAWAQGLGQQRTPPYPLPLSRGAATPSPSICRRGGWGAVWSLCQFLEQQGPGDVSPLSPRCFEPDLDRGSEPTSWPVI